MNGLNIMVLLSVGITAGIATYESRSQAEPTVVQRQEGTSLLVEQGLNSWDSPSLRRRALELDWIVRMQETRAGANMGDRPDRDWGQWHLHYRTAGPALLKYLYLEYIRTRCATWCTMTVEGENGLLSEESYMMGHGRSSSRIEVVDVNTIADLYILIMTEKLRDCAHLGNEAWSCFHSRTPELRRKYVWACMRWMTSEQVGRFINLEEYSRPPER